MCHHIVNWEAWLKRITEHLESRNVGLQEKCSMPNVPAKTVGWLSGRSRWCFQTEQMKSFYLLNPFLIWTPQKWGSYQSPELPMLLLLLQLTRAKQQHWAEAGEWDPLPGFLQWEWWHGANTQPQVTRRWLVCCWGSRAVGGWQVWLS